jgi:hypothetical protein
MVCGNAIRFEIDKKCSQQQTGDEEDAQTDHGHVSEVQQVGHCHVTLQLREVHHATVYSIKEDD